MKNRTSAMAHGQTREEWLLERRGYIGGSDIGKIAGVSRWGCPRSVAYEKLGTPKDFDSSDKAEFRRGNRLEGIAMAYYSEVTGREVRYTTRSFVAGKPHLSVSMDRLVYRKDDPEKEDPGYLEAKTLGRYSFLKYKKEGIPDDYILQVQYGCAVKGLDWGAYALYAPELDELIHFDVVADKALGEALLEKGDDFYQLHVELKILPDPLPEGSIQCEGCDYSLTCQNRIIPEAAKELVHRPDLEALVSKFAEVKGMGSEASDAEDELKAEILAAIKEQPGKYQAGRFQFEFTVTEQSRFKADNLKRKNPALYEECKEKSVVKTLKKPKEI